MKLVTELLEIWDDTPYGRAVPLALERLAENLELSHVAVWLPMQRANELEALDILHAARSLHVSGARLDRDTVSPLFSPSLTGPRAHWATGALANRVFGEADTAPTPPSFLAEFPLGKRPEGGAILVLGRAHTGPWSETELAGLNPVVRLLAKLVVFQDLAQKSDENTRKRDLDKELLGQVQDIARFGVWEFDVRACTLVGTPETAAILGVDRSFCPCTVWKFFELVHPEDRSRIEQELEALIGARSTQRCEFRIVRPDGSLRHVEIRGRLHWHHIATEDRVLGVILDVTDRRAAEQLRSEREAARLADEARSIFFANMSHEIRTPLHGIISYARFGLERSKSSDPKIHSYFDEISSSATQLVDLLGNLLELARMEAGSLAFSFESHPLEKLVNESWAEWEAAFQEKSMTRRIEGNPGHLVVLCDRTRLMQCLRNLLSNAWKFSKKGGEVGIRWELLTQGEVKITICNEGILLPSGDLERIFERFYQSPATAGQGGGSGLGLAICQEIIQGHHGHIWAENSPDGKTLFHFTLPTAIETGEHAT